jgi:hypothetical protein
VGLRLRTGQFVKIDFRFFFFVGLQEKKKKKKIENRFLQIARFLGGVPLKRDKILIILIF